MVHLPWDGRHAKKHSNRHNSLECCQPERSTRRPWRVRCHPRPRQGSRRHSHRGWGWCWTLAAREPTTDWVGRLRWSETCTATRTLSREDEWPSADRVLGSGWLTWFGRGFGVCARAGRGPTYLAVSIECVQRYVMCALLLRFSCRRHAQPVMKHGVGLVNAADRKGPIVQSVCPR